MKNLLEDIALAGITCDTSGNPAGTRILKNTIRNTGEEGWIPGGLDGLAEKNTITDSGGGRDRASRAQPHRRGQPDLPRRGLREPRHRSRPALAGEEPDRRRDRRHPAGDVRFRDPRKPRRRGGLLRDPRHRHGQHDREEPGRGGGAWDLRDLFEPGANSYARNKFRTIPIESP